MPLFGGPASSVNRPFTSVEGAAVLAQGSVPATNAPFRLAFADMTFNATTDPVMIFGYNAHVGGGAGARPLTSEPSFTLGIEGNWNTGAAHMMEAYYEYMSADGNTTFRPWYMMIDRATNVLSQIFLGDTLTFSVNPGAVSTLVVNGSGVSVLPSVSSPTIALLTINGSTAAGATESLLRMTAGGVTTAFGIEATTSQTVITAVGVELGRIYANAMSIGGNEDIASITSIQTGSKLGLIARAKAMPSASIFEAQDSSSVTLSRFDKDGYFMTRKAAAPADAAIATGEMALWFDATNGAAKLMVKAKQADGTVKTASVALA